ncbi:MAG: hypothetical protein ACQEXJ_20495 [Myxococcota bacterium]
MGRIYGYYDAWKGQPVQCTCGWEGILDSDGMELFGHLMAYECPECEDTLATVSYPTRMDIEIAAARGIPEAQKQLDSILAREREREEAEATADRDGLFYGRLESAQDLPDLLGGPHTFFWRFARSDVAEIGCGERVLWRERSCFEDWRRFNEVKDLLKERYGSGFLRLECSVGNEGYLLGDDLSAKLEHQ